MRFEEILDEMQDELDSAKQLPFTKGKVSVDMDKFHDLIAQLRLDMPGEIREAQKVVNDRRSIINDARNEAEMIVRKAEEKAKIMVSEEVITKQAQQRANELLTNAQTKSKEIRKATNDYVESMLTRIDDLLSGNLSDVRKTRAALKNTKG